MIHVDFSMFLDTPEVAKRVNRKTRRVLAQSGSYGRTTMKRLMKPGQKKWKPGDKPLKGRKPAKRKVSQPGQPPRTILGLIRKLIFFGMDNDAESVVIGPMKTTADKDNVLLGKETVPQLLNEGGRESLLFPNGERKTVTYEPRPFVEPAFGPTERKFRELIESVPL